MPNNRVKTTKALQSKKGKAVLSKLHPHSRRAKQITRIALRDDKLAANKKEKKKLGNALTSRLIWFAEAYKHSEEGGEKEGGGAASTALDLATMHALIARFLGRNAAHIAAESSKRDAHFSSRPKPPLLQKLETLCAAEALEYAVHGFVLPDLRTPENLMLLSQWKDDHRCDRSFLARVKLVRLFKHEPSRVVEEQPGATDSFRLEHSSLSSLNHGHSGDDDSDEDVQLIPVDE